MPENFSILDRKCKECGNSPAKYERCGNGTHYRCGNGTHYRRTCVGCRSKYMARWYDENDRADLYKPRALSGVMARPPLVKRCRRCEEVKRIADFRCSPSAMDGRESHCKGCRNEKREERRQRTPPNHESNRAANRRLRERQEPFRELVFAHYGNACRCCGETIREFITIDHLNNDGNVHRREKQRMTGILKYKEIVEAGFPDDLGLACYNCNSGRARTPDKICPHETARLRLVAA